MKPATRTLLQNLYSDGRNFVDDWEAWALRCVPPNTPEKALHAILIRLSKGILKSIRIFLNEAD